MTLANHRSLSSSFLSLPFTLLLKDPPESHSAELLTFCSSFVFVAFVSVTEREREQISSDRKNVKACLCSAGGWVGVGLEGGGGRRGAVRKGAGGQEVVDESGGGRDGGLEQGRGGQRGLPQK